MKRTCTIHHASQRPGLTTRNQCTCMWESNYLSVCFVGFAWRGAALVHNHYRGIRGGAAASDIHSSCFSFHFGSKFTLISHLLQVKKRTVWERLKRSAVSFNYGRKVDVWWGETEHTTDSSQVSTIKMLQSHLSRLCSCKDGWKYEKTQVCMQWHQLKNDDEQFQFPGNSRLSWVQMGQIRISHFSTVDIIC